MSRPVQDIRFWKIQHRPGRPKPYLARWVVDGEEHTEGFPTRALANRYRSRLVVAREDGERFDIRTGEPDSWTPQGAMILVYDWARRWLSSQWAELAPRTRKSYAEAMARFVALAVSEQAPERPPGTWPYLAKVLTPSAQIDKHDPHERWLRKWGLTLGDLNKAILADVDRQLGVGANGRLLAARTANRFRKNARARVRWAVELEKIPADPWPATARGRNRRKANRIADAVDVRRLPAPQSMAEVIDALPERRNAARKRLWKVVSAVGYYAGLRPSEVLYLRVRAVHLPYMPAGGWGLLEVQEADDGHGESAEPKTGYRLVPIPPTLTEWLRGWINELGLKDDDLLFETEHGDLPRLNLWGRALERGCETVGVARLTPYDLRHACATTWLQAGVPLGEAARRLGHSVQTLVAHYIQALTGDELTANERIEGALSDLARRVPVNNGQQRGARGNIGQSADPS